MKGITKYVEMKKNFKTAYENLWYAKKIVLRGKFIAVNIYIKKMKRISKQ